MASANMVFRSSRIHGEDFDNPILGNLFVHVWETTYFGREEKRSSSKHIGGDEPFISEEERHGGLFIEAFLASKVGGMDDCFGWLNPSP